MGHSLTETCTEWLKYEIFHTWNIHWAERPGHLFCLYCTLKIIETYIDYSHQSPPFTTTIKDLMYCFQYLLISVSAVGEASDDRQREKEDHVLGHFSRHRHHMCRLVALRPYWPHSRGDQTRLATPTPVQYYLHHFLIQHCLPASQQLHPPLYHTAVLTFPSDCSVAYGMITFLWQLFVLLSDAYLDEFITYMQMVFRFFEIQVSHFKDMWADALILTFTDRLQFIYWLSNTY